MHAPETLQPRRELQSEGPVPRLTQAWARSGSTQKDIWVIQTEHQALAAPGEGNDSERAKDLDSQQGLGGHTTEACCSQFRDPG